ncbi:hypothetical protein ACHAW6_007205 [Cyclotella cf. meneghiniana]
MRSVGADNRLKKMSSCLKKALNLRKQKPTPILTHVQTCTESNCIACNRSDNSTIFVSVRK